MCTLRVFSEPRKSHLSLLTGLRVHVVRFAMTACVVEDGLDDASAPYVHLVYPEIRLSHQRLIHPNVFQEAVFEGMAWRYTNDKMFDLVPFHLLRLRTPMPDDHQLHLDASSHIYSFSGRIVSKSVTSLIEDYEYAFDGVLAIKLMRQGMNWSVKRCQYLRPDGMEMSDTEILDVWERRKTAASLEGTYLHWLCEAFLNSAIISQPFPADFRIFLDVFAELRRRKIEPLRTELAVYSRELDVAGQIDFLGKNEVDKNFTIVDWKRCRALKTDNNFQSMRTILGHLPSCNFSKFCLQLHLYKYILQTEYSMQITSLYVALLHPDYIGERLVEVPAGSTIASTLIEERKWCTLLS